MSGSLVLRVIDLELREMERRIQEQIASLPRPDVDYGRVAEIVAAETATLRTSIASAEVIPTIEEVHVLEAGTDSSPSNDATEELQETVEELQESIEELTEALSVPPVEESDIVPTPEPAEVSPQESRPSRENFWTRPLFGNRNV